jgi:hypothetical protein
MEYVALSAATVAFTLCLHFFRIVGLARRIIGASGEALTTMRASALSDEEKETAIQRAAAEVMVALVALLARVGAAIALSLAVIYAGTFVNAYSMDAVMLAAGDWYFIAGSSLFVIIAMIVMR